MVSTSFAEVTFDPSVRLSCPNCDAERRNAVDVPHDTSAVTTGHGLGGIVAVRCVECEMTFDAGYEVVA